MALRYILALLSVNHLIQDALSWPFSAPPAVEPHASHQEAFASSRRSFLVATAAIGSAVNVANTAHAAVDTVVVDPVQVTLASGDVSKLFKEARALESQGNLQSAQRLYEKVTLLAPRFIGGWSQLGNTQTAFGELSNAEVSYSTAIDLCQENLKSADEQGPKCNDLYVLLLNRGALRLNNGRPHDALVDLQLSNLLRARPDAVVLQNLARAEELNGMYPQADRDYDLAVSMTSNEVSPFWLRSAIIKYQLGDKQQGFELLKRVSNRFPEAPEVRAAYAVFLLNAKGDTDAARQKFLEIPDRPRLKFADSNYLTQTIGWPPAMIDGIRTIARAVGDTK